MAEKKEAVEKEAQAESVESNELIELQKQLEEANAKAEDFKDKWMRNVAEFDNYKKRNANLYRDAYTDGQVNIITKMLFVGDSLDYALSMDLDQKTHEGLVNIKKKYDDAMLGMEVTEINPVGEVFDPEIAEAVMQAPAEEGDQVDTVKQVFQKGYKLKDKIIRYAKVSVIK